MDDPPACLERPAVSLVGSVDAAMVATLQAKLAEAEAQDTDFAIDLTTPGGDADMGRRLALEIRAFRARFGKRCLFLGKTAVLSAGVTFMSAFPVRDRFLTRDCLLLVHGRQLDRTVQLSGPLRSSLPVVESLAAQIRMGMDMERRDFEALVEGSRVTIDETLRKAATDWYLSAEEALDLGLVAGLV